MSSIGREPAKVVSRHCHRHREKIADAQASGVPQEVAERQLEQMCGTYKRIGSLGINHVKSLIDEKAKEDVMCYSPLDNESWKRAMLLWVPVIRRIAKSRDYASTNKVNWKNQVKSLTLLNKAYEHLLLKKGATREELKALKQSLVVGRITYKDSVALETLSELKANQEPPNIVYID